MNRAYARPESIEQLLALLQQPNAAILCGGTDLVVKIRTRLLDPSLLIDISELPPLRTIAWEEDRVEIGAAVTESELLASEELVARFPLMARVLRVLGSVQIRNRGTLGGNIVNASPAADSAIPLLLYDAEVRIAGPSGERDLPLERFLEGPGRTALEAGEFVRAISLRYPKDGFRIAFHKVGRRRALTIAIASAGSLIRVADGRFAEARLAAGSVAPTPLRLRGVEDMLRDEVPTPPLISEAAALAAETVSPIDDIRASATYRRLVTRDLVARFLEEAHNA